VGAVVRRGPGGGDPARAALTGSAGATFRRLPTAGRLTGFRFDAERGTARIPMRIAIVAHHVGAVAPPFIGGVESCTYYLARWLADRGHDVVLWAPPGSGVPGVDMRLLDLQPGFSDAARADVSMPPSAFMAAHHAYQHVMLELAECHEPFDLLNLHSLHYLPVAMAAMLPMPSLLTLHTPPTPWLESALRRRHGNVPSVAAVSRVTARLWEDVVDVTDIVPNGIDLDAWRRGPGGGGAVWSGRIVTEKAPHLAIDAARKAGMPLTLAGPVLDHAYWQAEVEPRLGGDVVHVGHLDHHGLQTLVGSADVAVVSSVWDEPFGLVAVEAMATGTPVAALARGALPEIIDERGGRLATTVDELADAMRSASRLDRDGVRRSARRFGLDAMGRRYEELYERLAAPAFRAVA
jgi:glycosyltransferase involved in cell wall biosynthesis